MIIVTGANGHLAVRLDVWEGHGAWVSEAGSASWARSPGHRTQSGRFSASCSTAADEKSERTCIRHLEDAHEAHRQHRSGP